MPMMRDTRRTILGGLGTLGFGLGAGCSTPSPSTPPKSGFKLGIDVLKDDRFAPIRGKRLGFVTNQTSVAASGQMSRKVLQDGIGPDLKALFGPEHGLDTRARAGDLVADGTDPVTGLKAFSLYGATRKPSPAMLSGLDGLIFEIQDIGVRSYTYISTMALAMEACGEAGKEFIVLDRPNPLGGVHVQGPPMEEAFRSFVGQVPVPYRHGLTTGELAKMIIAKGWIKANPRLTVIPMQGYSRATTWAQTGLNWVPTSPNIPYPTSPFYCAATGILGELREVDIGIGTDKPFQYAGARGVDGVSLAAKLTAQNYNGIRFTPYQSQIKPGFSGVELSIDPASDADLMALGMQLILEILRETDNGPLRASTTGAKDLFNKVYGSAALGQAIETKAPFESLVASWQPSLAEFRRERGPFLLYS
jgi:uncharacterized protein YbbC (DUF1343 family)